MPRRLVSVLIVSVLFVGAALALPSGALAQQQARSGRLPNDVATLLHLTSSDGSLLRSAAIDADTVVETEPVGRQGRNDTRGTAEPVPLADSTPGSFSVTRFAGALSPGAAAPVGGESAEDDGSIPLANDIDRSASGLAQVSGTIGDGPFGVTFGDFDFYAIADVLEGETILIDVDTSATADGLDSSIVLYDENGAEIASNDDEFEVSLAGETVADSYLEVSAPADGIYFVSIGGCCLPQAQPTDSSSGAGAGSTGDYRMVLGTAIQLPDAIDGGASEEPDDFPEEANEVALDVDQPVRVTGEIAEPTDGFPDFDGFVFDGLQAGQRLTIEMATPDGSFPHLIGLYDESIFLIDGAPGGIDGGPPASLETDLESSGRHYVLVSPDFDSLNTATGSYEAIITLTNGGGGGDVDMYSIELGVGDVVSVGLGQVAGVEILDPSGVVRSGMDPRAAEFGFANPSWGYPRDSPLRHQGAVGVDHVAAVAGPHIIAVSKGSGTYRGEVRVIRDDPANARQIIYLDFDGGNVDAAKEEAFSEFGSLRLSPMADFLFRWGLDQSEENVIIDKVIATVEAGLAKAAPRAVIDVRNSRDDVDPWGEPNVSRVIVGGSILETGIGTIGIAESIDVGNVDREETALVLLDSVSDTLPFGAHFNQIEIADGATKADMVATGLGNLALHEIGHLLGNWHTTPDNKSTGLMDSGGSLTAAFDIVGAGPDQIYGTNDDRTVDFTTDEFDPFELFNGFEDTANRTREALG